MTLTEELWENFAYRTKINISIHGNILDKWFAVAAKSQFSNNRKILPALIRETSPDKEQQWMNAEAHSCSWIWVYMTVVGTDTKQNICINSPNEMGK